MKFHSIYIWQNQADQCQQVVSWCHQTQYGTIQTDSVFRKEYLDTNTGVNLRDQKNSLSLVDLLGENISAIFSDWLQSLEKDEYLRIHLLNTLPKNWQQLPLEWCQWQGEPLHKKIQLVRYATPPKETLSCHKTEKGLILNLWPQSPNQQQFFENIIYDPDFQVIQGRYKSTLYIKNNDVSQLSLLCVIAHGNEKDFESPLLCEKNVPWSLPERQLPPLVLLIACGGEQGNLLLYGEKLLQRGAKTVLAAKGKLNASHITQFLEAFFKLWKKGLNAECILFKLQAEENAEHAARRIHVIGQSGLCQTTQLLADTEVIDWHTLSKKAVEKDEALLMLLDQLTLHNLVSYSNLASSVNDLYEALHFNYTDANEKRSLLYDRLEVLYPQCQPLTQKWLSCFLMYLSSLHQFNAIEQYQQEIARLQKIQTQGSDYFFFYLASSKYRSRHHEQAMKITVDGLNTLLPNSDASNSSIKDYKLTELALNISIVALLPELGAFFLEQTNNTLAVANLGEAQRALEAFTQLDRSARLSVHTGDPDDELNGDAGLVKCVQELQRKQDLAITTREETGERELCLLLYFSAWLKHETPNSSYYKEALTLLAPVDEICQQLSSKAGNLTKLYLLRALSAWAWQQQDKQAIALLEQYLPIIIKLCNNVARNNAAPLGFIIAYMALLHNPQAKQQWFYISNKMLSDKCYFELAIFHKLLKQNKKALIAYKKFKQQQRSVFDNMQGLKHGVEMDEYNYLLEETEERLAREKVMDIVKFDLGDMQRLGLVPC
jgi:hypothetical protein